MEFLEAAGFNHYWGYTPAVDFFAHNRGVFNSSPEINVLLSGCSDSRHFLLSMCNQLSKIPTDSKQKINIYVNELDKELLCRFLLQLTILNEHEFTTRERMELFLDTYGNTLIRQKSQNYLDHIIKEFGHLITQDPKCKASIRKIIDISLLKFKERDEIDDIFKSWHSKIPFDIEKYRDQRLRYHYKDRYDYRLNLIDWDYNNDVVNFSPLIHVVHYKRFRQLGLAFETRLATYNIPNRTLSSYAKGKKKGTGDSCLVRGYWGDIIISPFYSFGAEVDTHPEKEKFYEKGVMQYKFNSVIVTEFNIQHFIHKFEKLEDYHYPFEKFEAELREEQKRMMSPPEEKKEQKVEGEPSSEDEKGDPSTQDEKSSIASDNEEQKFQVATELLEGLKRLNLKIYLMSEELPAIIPKSRFSKFFDVAVIGFYHTQFATGKFSEILKKPHGVAYIEQPKNFVGIRNEIKEKCYEKQAEIVKKSGLKQLKSNYNHHYLFGFEDLPKSEEKEEQKKIEPQKEEKKCESKEEEKTKKDN